MFKSVILPSGEKVFSYEKIILDGHFTWNEATEGLTRLPKDIDTEKRIFLAAKQMEKVRLWLGEKPIIVSSWMRDEIANRKAGGAKNSRHLYGDALDFYCHHLTPQEIFKLLNHRHQIGGLSAYKSHVHIDFRGYCCRW